MLAAPIWSNMVQFSNDDHCPTMVIIDVFIGKNGDGEPINPPIGWLMLEPLVDHYEIRNENHCIIISIIIGLSRHHYDRIELNLPGQTVHWQGFTWLRANRIKSVQMALQRRLFLTCCSAQSVGSHWSQSSSAPSAQLAHTLRRRLAMSGNVWHSEWAASTWKIWKSHNPTPAPTPAGFDPFRSVLLQSVFVGSVCFMRFSSHCSTLLIHRKQHNTKLPMNRKTAKKAARPFAT